MARSAGYKPHVDLGEGISRYIDWIRTQSDIRDYFSEASEILQNKGIVHRVEMKLAGSIPDFDSPVVEHARKDFPLLDADMTVGDALERIRREGVGERVIYFYAIDDEKRLVGVVPTRRLLTAPLETPLREIMVRRVVAIPAKATVLDACEFFVLYKFLAFPVVDEQRRVVGVIDANLFAEEILEAGDTRINPDNREGCAGRPEFFEALGFHLEQIRGASPWRVFRFRFPWLLVTVQAARSRRFWRAFLKQHSPTVWSSRFFSRWCLA